MPRFIVALCVFIAIAPTTAFCQVTNTWIAARNDDGPILLPKPLADEVSLRDEDTATDADKETQPLIVPEPIAPSSRLQRDQVQPTPQKPIGGEQPIGEAPPTDINDLFLRQSTLLLGAGQIQAELAFSYTFQETEAVVVMPSGVPTMERIRNRRFLMPFSLRYGYSDDVELFASIPFGVALFERDNPAGQIDDSSGAIGDMTAGMVYQMLHSRDGTPDMTLTFNFTAPTGIHQFRTPNSNLATLGNGFWNIGGSVNMVRSFDPVVLFGGLGYRHDFQDDFFGATVQPGETATFSLGMGMAVNDNISLSAQVLGSVQSTTVIDGVSIPNSNNEPVVMQFGLIRRTSVTSRIQPFIAFGLTNDAPDYTIGVNIIRDLRPGCLWVQ